VGIVVEDTMYRSFTVSQLIILIIIKKTIPLLLEKNVWVVLVVAFIGGLFYLNDGFSLIGSFVHTSILAAKKRVNTYDTQVKTRYRVKSVVSIEDSC
jgi:hypothetical protein